MPCRRKLYLQTKNCLKNFELHLLLSWTATSLLRFRSQRISVSSVVDLLLLLIACHQKTLIKIYVKFLLYNPVKSNLPTSKKTSQILIVLLQWVNKQYLYI